ncbi:hypothetical protein NO2_0296 [Candidatus Termititenax persephonae]|uniref:Uncharacterized protein n=1 Tax=Candidatus Termititenax persephonae TaxID=2218525 RepID=A0A388TH78_9BACT|nr:hypothetical protein NO2_0296 [Candidatus Termititenax persephonae]
MFMLYLLIYLTACCGLCFLPIEHYAVRLFPKRAVRPQTGAILVWLAWLNVLIDFIFLGKGWLLCLLGNFWLDSPLVLFCGCLLALLSETFSPLREKRHVVALGLGFLTGWRTWTVPVSFLIALLILILSTSALSRSSTDSPARPRKKS